MSRIRQGARIQTGSPNIDRGETRLKHAAWHAALVVDERSAKILARSLVRQMMAEGYGRDQVVKLASALLGELTRRLQEEARAQAV